MNEELFIGSSYDMIRTLMSVRYQCVSYPNSVDFNGIDARRRMDDAMDMMVDPRPYNYELEDRWTLTDWFLYCC